MVWFIVACTHFCKPKEVRENLPLEGQVACVSLVTAIVTTVITVAVIALLIASWASIVSSQDQDSSSNKRKHFWLFSSSFNDFSLHPKLLQLPENP